MRAMRGQGATARRFGKMLAEMLGPGWVVSYISPVEGYWRRQDVYRVEGGLVSPEGRHRCFGSWDRLRDLVANGIDEIVDDGAGLEVHARSKKSATP